MDTHERFTRRWTQAQPAVRGFLAAMVADAHAVEDLTQEVAVALLRQAQAGEWPENFTGWAIGVAKNKARMFLRTRSRSVLVFDDALLESAAAAWEEMLPELPPRSAALQECVGELHGRGRELVRLRYLEGLAMEAIAQRLGMSSGAARVALNRVRTALRECIERKLPQEVPA